MAIIGNLSGDERHFLALREAGVMQRLVHLLEQSPESRIPELAAKTLAMLAANDANQTAIRLSGRIAASCSNKIGKPALKCQCCLADHTAHTIEQCWLQC